MSDKYILDANGNAVREPDLITWARWYEAADRRVALDRIGDTKVSTVFLSMDHNFGLDGPPVLWETMIFGGKHDQYQERYTSREDALRGHAAAVEMAKTPEKVPNHAKQEGSKSDASY